MSSPIHSPTGSYSFIGQAPQYRRHLPLVLENLILSLLLSLRHIFYLPVVATLFGLCACTITGPSLLGIAKIMYACIPEGVEIDTPDGTCAIEELRAGDLVIGFSGEPVRVLQKHSYAEDPLPSRFFRIAFSNGAVVQLCDSHRIAGIRARELSAGVNIGGTSVKTIETYGGVERSYDLLTEDEGYRVQGIPVNSMIEEMHRAAQDLRTRSSD
jgi:hypothetical protein